MPDTYMYDYAKAFRIIRAAFGLKQSDLAARMPITASQLSLIEAGKRQPSLRVVNALASAVGIPAALVSVLAASSDSIKSKPDAEISDLARALLRLLVSAKPEGQQQLKLEV
jgi:XRE family transcriptional regulator, fatty acid utilization regulator